ncbi:CopG family transcriptional regulator [Calothrix sp. NIES-3974]|uniref:CopG family transcriptional regulator n=1 Tax=Calothrix sp. NIES-3974 TaxID=2005462 RepID=UPI000B5F2CCA|nr:CopG family transcriptional regulator [Calothrix sp. NIES-3974]BAZ08024.1 helix-turn-helix protein, CopG [Calothrix sp. NIES-3974]
MSEKNQTSRFNDLITAARSRKLRDELLESPEQNTSKTKSTDPNYIRTTIYLPKSLHRQFKVTAALEERQMSDIVTELIEAWLKTRNQRGE